MKNLIKNTIVDFLNNKATDDITKHLGGIEIYNEFSMQHELGFLLKEAVETYNKINKSNFVVQFERNRMFFEINSQAVSSNFPKSEIDIVVYDKKGSSDKKMWEEYAIELKFPLFKQGKIPVHMYEFLEDIAFCESLVNNSNSQFFAAFAVTLVNTHQYCGHDNPKIQINKNCDDKEPYKHFRNSHKEKITKEHTFNYKSGKKNITFTMNKDYDIQWRDATNISAVTLKNSSQGKGIKNGKYFIVSIDKDGAQSI